MEAIMAEKRITVRVPLDAWHRLEKALAKRPHLSMNAFIVESLLKSLEVQKCSTKE
jgi:predicted HicB family RNase H-like nuclease